MKLITYKMTTDSGFAPNPFFGVLTLATCKPAIRRSPNIKKDNWISGWTSRTLCGDAVGQERLVYLAKIDNIIPIAEYWKDYPQKRNNGKDDNSLESFGDNIYEPTTTGFIAHANVHHNPKNDPHEKQKKRDIGGKKVIICKEFYYFGKDDSVVITNPSINRPTGRGHRFSNIDDNFINEVRDLFINTLKNKGSIKKDDFFKQIKRVTNYNKPSTCCKK